MAAIGALAALRADRRQGSLRRICSLSHLKGGVVNADGAVDRMDGEHGLEQPVKSLPVRPVTCQEPVRSDRAHFQGVGVNALRFEIVYDVLDQDFNL